MIYNGFIKFLFLKCNIAHLYFLFHVAMTEHPVMDRQTHQPPAKLEAGESPSGTFNDFDQLTLIADHPKPKHEICILS